jgi:hypothetical protein
MSNVRRSNTGSVGMKLDPNIRLLSKCAACSARSVNERLLGGGVSCGNCGAELQLPKFGTLAIYFVASASYLVFVLALPGPFSEFLRQALSVLGSLAVFELCTVLLSAHRKVAPE